MVPSFLPFCRKTNTCSAFLTAAAAGCASQPMLSLCSVQADAAAAAALPPLAAMTPALPALAAASPCSAFHPGPGGAADKPGRAVRCSAAATPPPHPVRSPCPPPLCRSIRLEMRRVCHLPADLETNLPASIPAAQAPWHHASPRRRCRCCRRAAHPARRPTPHLLPAPVPAACTPRCEQRCSRCCSSSLRRRSWRRSAAGLQSPGKRPAGARASLLLCTPRRTRTSVHRRTRRALRFYDSCCPGGRTPAGHEALAD